MTLRRRIPIGRTFYVCVALLAVLAVPSAVANPLLSGYGGPGQGSQTIIGSSLVNPPGGGGTSGQSGTGSSSELTVSSSKGSPSGGAVHHRHSAGARPKQGAAKQSPAAPGSVVGATTVARVSSSTSAGTLGLSGGDVLLIVFGLAALVLTAVLTRQLTRRTP